MRALSLTQPWPWIILHLGKRIENRSRNIGSYRGPLLLHASAKMTRKDWQSAHDFVKRRLGAPQAARIPTPGDERLVFGAVVARCCVTGQFGPGFSLLLWTDEGRRIDPRWYMGGHAYLFTEVEALPPLPCKGALGFWRPPASIVRAVRGIAA
jgi:hypothetical protein